MPVIIFIFGCLITAFGWSRIHKMLCLDPKKAFIPFAGSYMRFKDARSVLLYYPYIICKVLSIGFLLFSGLAYLMFSVVPESQFLTKPAVVVLLIVTYAFYVVQAVIAQSVYKNQMHFIARDAEDAVYLAFFPVVFTYVYSIRPKMLTKKHTESKPSSFTSRLNH